MSIDLLSHVDRFSELRSRALSRVGAAAHRIHWRGAPGGAM
jgi:hypothetical protein